MAEGNEHQMDQNRIGRQNEHKFSVAIYLIQMSHVGMDISNRPNDS
jgi:hypothetical protein